MSNIKKERERWQRKKTSKVTSQSPYHFILLFSPATELNTLTLLLRNELRPSVFSAAHCQARSSWNGPSSSPISPTGYSVQLRTRSISHTEIISSQNCRCITSIVLEKEQNNSVPTCTYRRDKEMGGRGRGTCLSVWSTREIHEPIRTWT